MAKTALYRHFDKFGTLLYVGIAGDLRKRDKQHAVGAAFAGEIATTQTEWFDERGEAISAERRAILKERPIYNSQKYTGSPSANSGWRKFMSDRSDEMGLSLRALSLNAGLSESYASGVLKGHRDPQLSKFIALCRVLEIDPATAFSHVVLESEDPPQ